MIVLRLLVVVCFALPPLAGAAQAQDRFKAGLADTLTTDPVDGVKMAGMVLYPTHDLGEGTYIAMFTVDAVRRAKIAPGRYPLIVLSHNAGGSRLDHNDTLAALARAGFIAAALEHPRDNYRDQTGSGTDRQLIGRSHHIKAFIDGLLADPNVGPSIDRSRIGIIGFSLGGYTALTSIGGKPNFALAQARLKAEPNDYGAKMVIKAQSQKRRQGFEPVHDPRIRAAVIMAPTLAYLFDRTALANVKASVRLYRAGKDEVLKEPFNVEFVRQNLPTPPEYEVVDAGHFIFFSVCSSELERYVQWICKDAPGIDRTAYHAKLNAEIIDFFRRSLDVN